MTWSEALVPAVGIAVLVRLDALYVGPYWSLVELLPEMGSSRGVRRHTIIRRFLIPAVVSVPLELLRPNLSEWDAALVGLLGAGLLLWPMVFTGLPNGVAVHDWQLYVLYSSMALAFGASALLGNIATVYGRDLLRSGGAPAFAREHVAELLVGLVWSALVLTAQERSSGALERKRQQRRTR